MNFLQRMLFYAMGGVFCEIIFTATKSFYTHTDLMLHGNTQLWVILMYSFGGLIFEHFQKYPVLARLPTYVVLIYTIEYWTGYTIRYFVGECPWNYSEYGNVHGLIQLMYLPFWSLFAVIADYGIYVALHYNLIHRVIV